MPLYEYLCGSCGHRFERIRKFSDPPLTECPSCGGQVEKQISSPAIQFKGAGWYVNDYAKSGSSEKKADSSKESAPAASNKEGAKTEAASTDSKTDKASSTPAATPSPAPAPDKK